MSRNQLIVGPSNGWLYPAGIFPLGQQQELLKRAGANAIELCPTDARRILSLRRASELRGFDFVSLHLPDYSSFQQSSEGKLLRGIEAIVERHKPAFCLIHPLEVAADFFDTLSSKGIRVAIENMDRAKTSGHKLKELLVLLQKFKLKFVLDLQHAFEWDPTMEYAWDLLQMAGEALSYFHVSGESADSNHVLVHKAKNRKTILDFLGRANDYLECLPALVLEGEHAGLEELRREITFLRKELC